MSFTTSAPGTDTTSFSLSDGNVVIHRQGVYFISAECSFDGNAQMRFRINSLDLWDTVIGKADSKISTLSSYTIVTIGADDTVLRWHNPSSSGSTIPAETNARLTIIGIDNLGPEYHDMTAYGEFVRSNDNVQTNFCDLDASEEKLFLIYGYGCPATVAPGNFLAFIQQTPEESGMEILPRIQDTVNFSSIATGRWAGSGQMVISGDVGLGAYFRLNFLRIPSTQEQAEYVGGSAKVYDNLVLLALENNLWEHYYTVVAPDTDLPIAQYEGFPLDSCTTCDPFIVRVSDTQVKLVLAGNYLVSIVANLGDDVTPVERSYKLMVGASEVPGSRTKSSTGSQIVGMHLVHTTTANRIMYTQVTNTGFAVGSTDGTLNQAIVSMFIVLLS